jgi:hypothetical protein
MTATLNPYERAARLEKATKLADVLAASGVTADILEQCHQPDSLVWEQAARHADVKAPSEATCKLVCHMLRNRARVAETDLFERFQEAS